MYSVLGWQGRDYQYLELAKTIDFFFLMGYDLNDYNDPPPDYDGSLANAPVYDVARGVKVREHVTHQNSTSSSIIVCLAGIPCPRSKRNTTCPWCSLVCVPIPVYSLGSPTVFQLRRRVCNRGPRPQGRRCWVSNCSHGVAVAVVGLRFHSTRQCTCYSTTPQPAWSGMPLLCHRTSTMSGVG